MKMPPSYSPPSPFRRSQALPRTTTGAAIELLRIEFERARHRRELHRLRVRGDTARAALSLLDHRVAALCSVLGQDGDTGAKS